MSIDEGFSDAVFLVGPTPRSLIVGSEEVDEDITASLDLDGLPPTSD